jgi:D-proline reductase (dithiol) PrdB
VPVDSYKYIPLNWRKDHEAAPMKRASTIWTPLQTPLPEARLALLTTAGVYLSGTQESFDLEGERRNPTWGDPGYRVIPRGAQQAQMDFAHLHINTRDHHQDFNIALPLDRFAELESEGRIGRLADDHYSVMGFQSDDGAAWKQETLPEITRRMKAAEVDALVLAPA